MPGRYKVVKQEHNRTFREDGTPGGEWTVHLEHQDGTRGHVKLPEEHYSAENVHILAQHQADTVHAIAQLPDQLPPTVAPAPQV